MTFKQCALHIVGLGYGRQPASQIPKSASLLRCQCSTEQYIFEPNPACIAIEVLGSVVRLRWDPMRLDAIASLSRSIMKCGRIYVQRVPRVGALGSHPCPMHFLVQLFSVTLYTFIWRVKRVTAEPRLVLIICEVVAFNNKRNVPESPPATTS